MKALALMTLILASLGTPVRAQNVSLAGQWRFQLDREDAGIKEAWFNRVLSDSIKLPGSLSEQGIGDDISTNTLWVGGIVDKSWFVAPEYAQYREPGNVKVPFWLQPEKYYAGAAWFQRDIEIPTNWVGRRVVLFLERAHWETRVWVDANLIGTNNSLSTPHEYDLGQLASGKHTLTVRVDNRMIVDIGENSHGITDHTQGNWNGIVGKIELRTTPLVWLEEVRVTPNASRKCALVEVRLGNATGKRGKGVGRIWKGQAKASPFPDVALGVSWDADEKDYEPAYPPLPILSSRAPISQHGKVKMEVVFGGAAELWDEFNPSQQSMIVEFEGDSAGDSREITFGLREVATSGTQFLINSNKTFFRGTLECAIFPRTGHPPMEVEEWRRIIGVAKSYGLNLLRFHSYCPPEAAFQAADELGMYFQIETCWPNQSTTIGDGKPVDQWVYDETDRILKYYGNHPSFVLMACGNEPGGRKHKEFLAKYVSHYRAKDPRRLWTSGSGWPELAENEFHVTPQPRVQQWGEGLNSRINAQPPETMKDYRDFTGKRKVPVISHEIGQWCVYPNFDEIPKYTGYLKPKNFEIFRDRLVANGLGSLAKPFLVASGKLQTLCYKEDIESALRTPGMGGFQLLDLHDFPGQGTALVGVLDPFWEEKGYVTAKEYSRFCNATVPLARLKKRVFTTDETLEAEIEVAHFGPLPVLGNTRSMAPEFWPVTSEWKLAAVDGPVVASGQFANSSIPVGSTNYLGRITVATGKLPAPTRYQLSVSLRGQMWTNGFSSLDVRAENNWDIWVYPSKPALEPPKDVLITAQFNDAAQRHVESGGKLLLTLPGNQVRNFDVEPVKLGFSSIFWNTAWTGRQAPTTLGILCHPSHPALAEFPTEFHSNWQWWYLIRRAGALRLDLLPREIEPVVRVIDDWVTARPLGLIVEAKVGQGSALVCGFDLTRDSDDPVSRQMRASLLRYMASPQFKPTVEVSPGQVKGLQEQLPISKP